MFRERNTVGQHPDSSVIRRPWHNLSTTSKQSISGGRGQPNEIGFLLRQKGGYHTLKPPRRRPPLKHLLHPSELFGFMPGADNSKGVTGTIV